MAKTLTDTLDEVVGILVEAARPQRIILFGSHARGEQTSHSDLDLIVIEGHVPDRWLEMVRLQRALKTIRMPIDVLVFSEDDVRDRSHWLGTPLYEALREGNVL
jgi:predicted nucleotidyltransferase